MESTDFNNFDFGKHLTRYMEDVLSLGGTRRDESAPTEGQRVLLNATRRELVKYVDPNRQGYPLTQLEQMESFSKTVGDLHNSHFDDGMHKISDCLYNRWKMIYEDAKKLALAGGANQPAWVDVIEVEHSDMPVFFDV